jgi:hypothetical protein
MVPFWLAYTQSFIQDLWLALPTRTFGLKVALQILDVKAKVVVHFAEGSGTDRSVLASTYDVTIEGFVKIKFFHSQKYIRRSNMRQKWLCKFRS